MSSRNLGIIFISLYYQHITHELHQPSYLLRDFHFLEFYKMVDFLYKLLLFSISFKNFFVFINIIKMVFRVLKDKKVTDGNIDLLSNVHQTDYDKVKLMDRIIIGDNTGYNLNLISYRYYGTEEHVDVLMKFNRIPSIFDIKENMPILIPEIESYREHTKLINIKPIVKQNKTELKPEDNLNSTKANTNKPSSTKTPYKGVVKKKNGVIIF